MMIDEELKVKIIRLFELSRNNPNRAEAESAKGKAEKLMKEYNITYEDLFIQKAPNEYTYTHLASTDQTTPVPDNAKIG
jgi:hypothetical protein